MYNYTLVSRLPGQAGLRGKKWHLGRLGKEENSVKQALNLTEEYTE